MECREFERVTLCRSSSRVAHALFCVLTKTKNPCDTISSASISLTQIISHSETSACFEYTLAHLHLKFRLFDLLSSIAMNHSQKSKGFITNEAKSKR